MKKAAGLLIAVTLCATTALAHGGVQNANVKTWMSGMKTLAGATKNLGQMAKGQRAFDTGTAQTSLAAIETHAAAIPDLFETQATDPKSEALDAIWTNWDDFVDRSNKLAEVAAAAQITDQDDLRQTLGRIGKACKSCHADYRE